MESMETIPEETSQNLECPDDCGCYPVDGCFGPKMESGIVDELSVSVTLDNKDILVCPVSYRENKEGLVCELQLEESNSPGLGGWVSTVTVLDSPASVDLLL